MLKKTFLQMKKIVKRKIEKTMFKILPLLLFFLFTNVIFYLIAQYYTGAVAIVVV